MDHFWERIPILNRVVEYLKIYSLPGFQGVSVYEVISFVYKETMRDDILTRANSVAFSIFLSLFPTFIFIFTLLPLLPFTVDYLEVLRTNTAEFFPTQAHDYLFNIIDEVAQIKRQGLLSIGFVLALVFSSSGMMDLMNGFDKFYHHAYAFKRRNYFKKRLIALLLVLFHALILFLTLYLMVFGGKMSSEIQMPLVQNWLYDIVKWVTMFFLMYVAITTIYRFGPSLKKRISWISPGAILATLLTILISLMFSIFINNFGKYNEIYGSIGALIVFLIWLQINALIILIGFELNASIAVNKIANNQEKELFT